MNNIKLPACTSNEHFIYIEFYKFANQCLFDIKDDVYSGGEKIPLIGTQNY